MWLPEWLYKRLPTLYALAGVATLVVLKLSTPTAVSAMLLFGAAGLTHTWRRDGG